MDDDGAIASRSGEHRQRWRGTARRSAGPASTAVGMIARPRSTDPVGNGFRNVLPTFGRPICGMGFAGMSSYAKRYDLCPEAP